MLKILNNIFRNARDFFSIGDEDSINFLNRQIIYAMFEDVQGVITDLGQMKLDYMLDEVSSKDPIPDLIVGDFNEEDLLSRKSTKNSIDRFGTFEMDWYKNKDWKLFII